MNKKPFIAQYLKHNINGRTCVKTFSHQPGIWPFVHLCCHTITHQNTFSKLPATDPVVFSGQLLTLACYYDDFPHFYKIKKRKNIFSLDDQRHWLEGLLSSTWNVSTPHLRNFSSLQLLTSSHCQKHLIINGLLSYVCAYIWRFALFRVWFRTNV